MIIIGIIRKYLVHNKSFPFYQTRETVFKMISDSIYSQIYLYYNPLKIKIWFINKCVKIHNKVNKI